MDRIDVLTVSYPSIISSHSYQYCHVAHFFHEDTPVTSNTPDCPLRYINGGICHSASSEVAMVKGLKVIATPSAMNPINFSLHVQWEYHENNCRLY